MVDTRKRARRNPHQVAYVEFGGLLRLAMSTNNELPRSDDRFIAVKLRDREQCQACKQTEPQVDRLVVHQVVPTEEAGQHLSNFLLLCEECHRAAVAKSQIVG